MEKESKNLTKRYERFQTEVDSFLKKINTLTKKLSGTEVLEKKKQILRVLKSLYRGFKYGLTIGLVFFIVNKERTNYKIEVTRGENEINIYKHPDEYTTHILNVLAGKEQITEEDLLKTERRSLSFSLKRKNIKPTKKLEEMSIDELDDLFTQHMFTPPIKRGIYKEGFYKSLASLNRIDTDYQPNNDVYELVWRLAEECNSPIIRLLDDSSGERFSPFQNTVYITLYDILDLKRPEKNHTNSRFYGEMAHSIQHDKQTIDTLIQTWIDEITTISRMVINFPTIYDTQYDRLYHEPGTKEHSAHSIVGLYLQNKYPLYVNKNK